VNYCTALQWFWTGNEDAIIPVQLGFLLSLGGLNACFFLGRVSVAALISVAVVVAVLIIAINLLVIRKQFCATGVAFIFGALGISIGICISSYYYYTLQQYKNNQISGISVSQAALFNKFDVYYFKDGEVNTLYIGEYLKIVHSEDSSGHWHYYYYYYCAAPIISTNWTLSTPVTLWAFCYTKSRHCRDAYINRAFDCMKNWDQAVLSGVRVEGLSYSYASSAVDDAIKTFGLYDTPNSPRIYWDNPETIFSQWEQIFKLALLLPNIIWLAITAVALPFFIYTKIKSRKSYSSIS